MTITTRIEQKHLSDVIGTDCGRVKTLQCRFYSAHIENGQIVKGLRQDWSSESNADYIFDQSGNLLLADYNVRVRKPAELRCLNMFDHRGCLVKNYHLLASNYIVQISYVYNTKQQPVEIKEYEFFYHDEQEAIKFLPIEKIDEIGYWSLNEDGELIDRQGNLVKVDISSIAQSFYVQHYQYDQQGRLVEEKSVNGHGDIYTCHYEYDEKGNRVSNYYVEEDYVESFIYDDVGRLLEFRYNDQLERSFSYDDKQIIELIYNQGSSQPHYKYIYANDSKFKPMSIDCEPIEMYLWLDKQNEWVAQDLSELEESETFSNKFILDERGNWVEQHWFNSSGELKYILYRSFTYYD